MINGNVEIEALFGVRNLFAAKQAFAAFGYKVFDLNRLIKKVLRLLFCSKE